MDRLWNTFQRIKNYVTTKKNHPLKNEYDVLIECITLWNMHILETNNTFENPISV